MVPIVATVATVEPEVAANMAQVPMLACMSPPGSQESHWIIDAYILSEMPERSKSSPIRMKSGIAIRTKLVLWAQNTSPKAI